MNLPPTISPEHCDRYWDDADWIPPWYILDLWCQNNERCRQAKQQALLSACERGEVDYRRSDCKTFDDPVHELAARGLLMIGRASFSAWATRLDGKSPLSSTQKPTSPPRRPAWVDNAWSPKLAVLVTDATSPMPAPVPIDAEADDSKKIEDATPRPRIAHSPPAVPSSAIIEAFQIRTTETENAAWWDQRMRDAKRYGLLDARMAKGRLQTPSYWRPDLIALWLCEKNHLSAKAAKRIVAHQFPDWADTLDYLDD
jgi:hypothetical protein